MEYERERKLVSWLSDCFKGVVGAVIATIILALLQYIGSHIPGIFQLLVKAITATGAIRITKQ